MALLFVWGSIGSRWLALPVIVVEAGMLLAIPIYGSHYLVDMLGGLLLFVLALGLWRACIGPPREVAPA